MLKTVLTFLLFLLTWVGYSQTIQVEISGIKTNAGQILIGVYTSDDAFQNQEPIKRITVSKKEINNGNLTALIEGLKPGAYALALMDDSNMDRLMEYRFFLPKEGYGFSNYYHTGIARVRFNDFKFDLRDKDITVFMRVQYLFD